ncbi:hypothetical protein RP75_22155 [Agrobacterium arsenijevicii]|uniref:Uncharacterized protein n=1 Tax=Agrobacterium arsenijevicii TaxID=1585697 RepID=A0ABR5D258_9HYPH|nr:hypothetical protein RP75_22155 [Agrobacterium arsenijevicii]
MRNEYLYFGAAESRIHLTSIDQARNDTFIHNLRLLAKEHLMTRSPIMKIDWQNWSRSCVPFQVG